MSNKTPAKAIPTRIIVPAQAEDPDANWEGKPEHELLYAILEDAVNLVVRVRSNATETRKAYEWICSNDARWPFSFLNICRELEIDAENLRARVEKAQPPLASYRKKTSTLNIKELLE